MKKFLMLLTLAAAMVVVTAGLTSCQKEDNAADKPAAETKQEEGAKAADHPDAEKPKDHPAH